MVDWLHVETLQMKSVMIHIAFPLSKKVGTLRKIKPLSGTREGTHLS